MPSRVEKVVLRNAAEEAALHELLWELASVSPEASEESRRSEAVQAIRQLHLAGYITLERDPLSEKSGPLKGIPASELPGVLDDPNSWSVPSPKGTFIRLMPTESGIQLFKGLSFTEPDATG